MVFNGLHISILLFVFVGLIMAAGALAGAFFLSPRARGKQTGMPYECGMRPLKGARIQFHLNYYIYALIFLAFEVDVLYLFPVALFLFRGHGDFRFFKSICFSPGSRPGSFVFSCKGSLQMASQDFVTKNEGLWTSPYGSAGAGRKTAECLSRHVFVAHDLGLACCAIEMMAVAWPVSTWPGSGPRCSDPPRASRT